MNKTRKKLKFEPKKWNTYKALRKSHNCYSYFLNKIQKGPINACKKRLEKGKKYCATAQPGYYAGYKRITNDKKYTCKNLDKRIKADNKYIYRTTVKKQCPKTHYMGALAIDPKNTYHFYRRDDNGKWSHKDGGTPATRVDASGNIITNLEKANKNYGNINYSKICNYYCVPYNTKKKFMRITPRKRKNKSRKIK